MAGGNGTLEACGENQLVCVVDTDIIKVPDVYNRYIDIFLYLKILLELERLVTGGDYLGLTACA